MRSAEQLFVSFFLISCPFALLYSVKQASEMADTAFESFVVGAISVKQALVAGAIHNLVLRSFLFLHVGVLRLASPRDQVFSRLEGGAHDSTREQIVELRLQSALHLRLVLQRRSIEVESAFAHKSFPLLALELVVASDLEDGRVLAPGGLADSVPVGIHALSKRHSFVSLALRLLLGEHIGELSVEDGVARLLTQLGFDLGTVLHCCNSLSNF
mmetsp:Transcript_30126/g.35222  ORF Transcript_30126/g.35222 Transcript_30126/m.35222 type:complete len:214 (-) Transcript_30126:6-647(-)